MGCKQAAHLGAKVLQDNGKKCYGGKKMAQDATGSPSKSMAGARPRSDLNALVVVRHAVDVAVMVDGEGHAVQRLGAHHAAEAAGVVRVPESLQDLRTQNNPPVSGVPLCLGFSFGFCFFFNPPPPKKMAPEDQTHSAVPVVGIYVAQIW